VLLHDHLDGGIRPRTVIELARETGYTALPTEDPTELEDWFHRCADRLSLELYLETFVHTVGVILMIVGGLGVLLGLVFWSSWAGPGYRRGPTTTTTVDDRPV
jgi:adenosine deaminase